MTAAELGIACAALTCVAWGSADYLAALVTRRVGETGALLRIQLVGAPILLIAWAVLRPPLPTAANLGWISLAACCFVVGYLAFFYGLRVGVISLVSPVSSAGAAVPVLAGIGFLGEVASGTRLAGFALTLMGISLLLADPAAIGALAPDNRRRGVKAGVVTLLAWGTGTALLLPAIRSAGAFQPVAVLRLEVLAIMTAWWLLRSRGSWAASVDPTAPSTHDAAATPLWPLVIPAALLDLTAFFAYGVALRDAPVVVAAPIASAYPLVTILIARHRLQERLSSREWSGVGLTLAGVAILGAGCCDAP